jgi:hypothetical protein
MYPDSYCRIQLHHYHAAKVELQEYSLWTAETTGASAAYSCTVQNSIFISTLGTHLVFWIPYIKYETNLITYKWSVRRSYHCVCLFAEFPHVQGNFPAYVTFEFFTAVTMRNAVFCDVMQCGICKNRRFRRVFLLLVTAKAPSSPILVILLMEAIRFSGTSVH